MHKQFPAPMLSIFHYVAEPEPSKTDDEKLSSFI